MTTLSSTQLELLYLLKGSIHYDVRSNGYYAIVFDNYHYCQSDYPVLASTVKALVHAGKLAPSGIDTFTGWTIYKLP